MPPIGPAGGTGALGSITNTIGAASSFTIIFELESILVAVVFVIFSRWAMELSSTLRPRAAMDGCKMLNARRRMRKMATLGLEDIGDRGIEDLARKLITI